MTYLEGLLIALVSGLVSAAASLIVVWATGKFQTRISEAEIRSRFRLAALDKRLEAHQQGFSLIWKLRYAAINDMPVSEPVNECRNWWLNNCLYLDEAVRDTFIHTAVGSFFLETSTGTLAQIHITSHLTVSGQE